MINKENALQVGLFIIGIAFICYGMYRCEVDTVLGKAIKICLECVGIS